MKMTYLEWLLTEAGFDIKCCDYEIERILTRDEDFEIPTEELK